MITCLIACLLVGLMTYGITETIHHSSLFTPLVAELEARNAFLAELVECPHCLSYYAAGWSALVVLLFIHDWDLTTFALFLISWFGGRKLASMLNDLFHDIERMHTPEIGEADGSE